MKLNKKIILITISIILIISIVTGIIIFKNINKPEEIAERVIETTEGNIIAESELVDETNIVTNDEIANEEVNTENNQEETIISQTQEEVKIKNNSNANNKQTQVSTQTKTSSATSSVKSKPQTTESISNKSTSSQSSNSQTTAVTQSIPKEEYIRNDQMINKIKTVIQNNETEDMKNLGYQIVVDSSIKELTNQFTYTESRVKNYLKYKFGTIRIYAEDYYYDGQFIMTECYII